MYFTNAHDNLPLHSPVVSYIYYDGVQITDASLFNQYLAAELNGVPVNGIGETDFNFQMDRLGGLAGRNECTITLLNHGSLSDTLLQYDIENSPIEVWQGYRPASGQIDIEDDFVLLFKGVVYDWESWDFDLITLQCLDSRDVDDVNIGRRTINRTDFPAAPEESVNQPIPLLFGDFSTANTATYGTYTRKVYEVAHHELNVAPMVIANNFNNVLYAHDGDWTKGASDEVFHLEGEADWVGVTRNGDWSSATDGAGAEYLVTARGTSLAPSSIYMWPAQRGPSWSVSVVNDVIYPFDTNYTNLTTILGGETMGMTFRGFTDPGAFRRKGISNYWDININITCSSVTNDGPSNGNIVKIGSLENGRTTDALRWQFTPTEQTWLVAGLNTFGFSFGEQDRAWDKLRDMELQIIAQGAANCTVQAVWVVATYYPGLAPKPPSWFRTFGNTRGRGSGIFPNQPGRHRGDDPTPVKCNFYVSGKGAVFPSWITDGGRSTGYAAGALIENPAYVIEWILREVMGVATTDIDLTSFDAIGNTTNGTRKDWKIAASIGTDNSAVEYIRKICQEFGLILYQAPDASSLSLRWRLVTLPDQSSTVVDTITTSELHTGGDGHPSLFRISQTPVENIRNDMHANYFKSYVIDDYTKSVYVSDVDNDSTLETNLIDSTGALRGSTYDVWMAESQTKYGTTNKEVLNLDFIRDPATADASLKTFCNWFAFRRLRVEMNVKRTLDTLTYRIGDVLKINHAVLGSNHNNVSYFMVTRINYPPVGRTVPPYITLEVEEVPSAITGSRT